MSNQDFWEKVLKSADVHIGGNRKQDITINDEKIYDRILRSGRLAIGEGFVDKSWDSRDLKSTLIKILESGVENDLRSWSTVYLALKARLVNLQTPKRSFMVGEDHYDLSNDFYELMIGHHMQYTCDVWKSANSTLREAQETKMDQICKKLQLSAGKRLLDIGCGWGGLMNFAAKNYGVSCVGLSISKEQTS